MSRKGLSSLQQQFTFDSNVSNNGLNLKAVRIISIVLDEQHPRFEELGGWNGIGTIEYQDVDFPVKNKIYSTARPLLSNLKKFPLINEVVYLVVGPNTNIGTSLESQNGYYIDIISLWNHPHHNGYPENPQAPTLEQQKDYQQTQAGSVRRVTDQSTEINLGNTFIERANIHPLLPFEGDILQEGRWGNSIRFSSTIKNKQTGKSLNNWSLSGTSGDPITIIRNGQGQRNEEGWVPITEEINNDNSSIYLTSTQSIPLIASSTNYFSYSDNTKPTTPDQYTGKQIVINSGRLMFNASEDHLLLSSAKSISLSTPNTVNIDSQTLTIQTDKIYLGSKNSTEPLMLGNSTVDLLRQLIDGIKSLTQTIAVQVGVPPGAPLEPTATSAKKLIPTLTQLVSNLDTLTSKDNFTS